MANDLRIEQLWIPDAVDGPDAADFLAAIEVGRKVRMQTWGSDDLAYAPQEKLLEMADPYERQVILVAKIGGEIVGTVDIALPLSDNLDLAEFTLDILPEFQGRGVGRQLLEAAEHFARDEGRHRILIDTNHPGASLGDSEAGQLVPGSGLGFERPEVGGGVKAVGGELAGGAGALVVEGRRGLWGGGVGHGVDRVR